MSLIGWINTIFWIVLGIIFIASTFERNPLRDFHPPDPDCDHKWGLGVSLYSARGESLGRLCDKCGGLDLRNSRFHWPKHNSRGRVPNITVSEEVWTKLMGAACLAVDKMDTVSQILDERAPEEMNSDHGFIRMNIENARTELQAAIDTVKVTSS